MAPDLRRLAPAVAILASAAAPLVAQTTPALDPRQTVIYRSDSITAVNPHQSPDGNWVAFTRRSPAGSSLWMARVPDGPPVRLTEDGSWDDWPVFSPTNDRVFFVSQRASRGAGNWYLMSIPVDLKSGRPAGAFRRINVDKIIPFPDRPIRDVSRDGRIVAYSPDATTLKVVDADGGNGRVIGKGARIIPASFSLDNKWIYYTEILGGGASVVKREPVSGGPAQEMARAADAIVQAYAADPEKGYQRFRPSLGKTTHVELVDYSGRVLVAAERPSVAGRATVDGRGAIGAVSTTWMQLAAVDVATRAVTRLQPPAPARYLGLLADGNVAVSAIGSPAKLSIVTLAGATVRHLTLNDSITRVLGPVGGRRYLIGLGPSATPNSRAEFLIDPASGAARILSPATRGGCCHEATGFTNGIAETDGATVRVYALDAQGNRALARSFSEADFDKLWDRNTHGRRIAYAMPNDRGDTVSIFVAEGPDTPAWRLGSVAVRPHADPSWDLTWSPRGDRVAIVDQLPDGANRVMFFAVGDDHKPVTPRVVDAGVNNWDDYMWARDGSGIVFVGTPKGGTRADLVFRPADPAKPPVVLVRGDRSYPNFVDTSADGKTVYFADEVPKGTIVYTVNFFPGVKVP